MTYYENDVITVKIAAYGENHSIGEHFKTVIAIMNNLSPVCQELGRMWKSITCQGSKGILWKITDHQNSRMRWKPTIGSWNNEQLRHYIWKTKATTGITVKLAAYGENHSFGEHFKTFSKRKELKEHYEKAMSIKTAVYVENRPFVGETINIVDNIF